MDNFIDIVAEALQKEVAEMNLTDDFREYDEWDSLAVLSLGAAINMEYSVVIPRNEFDKFKTLNDIRTYIEANQ